LRALLRREGFEVETAADAETALARLGASPFDVVLADKNLPGKSGLELLDRAHATRKDVEIIMITGYASLDSAITALRAGAYDYLVKPFADLTEVAEKVRRAAEKAHLTRENLRLAQDLRARNQMLEQALAELRQTRQEAIEAARLGVLEALAADPTRMQHLIGELAELAHRGPPSFAPCDLERLVREVLAELDAVSRARGVETELVLPSERTEVELDDARVRAALRSLLREAVEQAPRGAKVRLEARVGEGRVELAVRGEGADAVPSTTSPFGTPALSSTRPIRMGVGIALLRRVAEEHGGEVLVTRREGERVASAALRLPISRAPLRADP
jgi:DNA-binding response OmpR family regulator